MSFRSLGIAALVGAPTIIGLVVLVFLPLVSKPRLVTGSGSVVVKGPIQLDYQWGSTWSPRRGDYIVSFDMNEYKEGVGPKRHNDVAIRNLSLGPVRVESSDTFVPGYIGLLYGNERPVVKNLYLRPGETCFAQLGSEFSREEWQSLKPGDYPFEVNITALPVRESNGVRTAEVLTNRCSSGPTDDLPPLSTSNEESPNR